MKNASLILNVLLVILVGYLYFAVFSNKRNVEKSTVKPKQDTVEQREQIAYIDLDSLQAHYGYYQQLKSEFEKKQTAANNEITALQKRFQNRTSQLQQQASTMTPEQQEKAMMEIDKMQRDFQTRRETLDKDLFDYNTKMKDDILDRIEEFLKHYNRDGRFSYVFSYEPGFMFYKDSTLNITADVVQGLNAEAKNEKK